ncbi:GTP-binding protein [Chloropicon primus]|uniref:GTP-binding protein n=2 Tax=Chloropicon primus TaxID=1764295 RepID=A0A5B8MYM2_9CHLO|nr:GTP-binding protein [Chloropicon primus]UPR05119.1 GTP-binding protein [Chloropicon primus]|eukprot:QDZ25918.1 GTP-binding protein [Chloropicon primus]
MAGVIDGIRLGASLERGVEEEEGKGAAEEGQGGGDSLGEGLGGTGSRRTFAFTVNLDEEVERRESKLDKCRERERKKREGRARQCGSHGVGPSSSTRRDQEEGGAGRGGESVCSCGGVSVSTTSGSGRGRGERRRSGPKLWLGRENPEGNVEYKLKLVKVSCNRLEHLVTQMKFRFSESSGDERGTCVYYLGVQDDGFCRGLVQRELKETLGTLISMCAILAGSGGAKPRPFGEGSFDFLDGLIERHAAGQDFSLDPFLGGELFTMKVTLLEGYEGKYASVHVRLIPKQHAYSYTELRVAMCGAHDAGKSTLMSVLTHGEHRKPLLCNGMGQARSRVFTHRHEVESGRTSSIAHEVLAYGKNGLCLNYQTDSVCWPLSPVEMSREAGKMLRLFDLSGHERYLKTTCYGLTCLVPDFVMLIVSAQEGVSEMTREHAALARVLGAPIFVVMTKIDLTPSSSLEGEEDAKSLESLHVYKEVKALLGENSCTELVQTIEQARELGKRLGKQPASSGECGGAAADAIVPVLGVSCVSGDGMTLLHAFLKKLRPRDWRRRNSNTKSPAPEFSDSLAGNHAQQSQPSEALQQQQQMQLLHFQVYKTFEVPAVGHVLFGTVLSGKIKVGYQLLLGPMEDGSFSPVRVKSIERSQVPVNKLAVGQTGTLALDFKHHEGEKRGFRWESSERARLDLHDLGGSGKAPGSGKPEESSSINIPCKASAEKAGSPPHSHSFSPSSGGSPPTKKGTVLLRGLTPSAARSFRAVMKLVKDSFCGESSDLSVIDDITFLSKVLKGSTVVVHCGSIRQAAAIASCRALSDLGESGVSAQVYQALEDIVSLKQEEIHFYSLPLLVDLKFLHWAEWMPKGSTVVLRNQQTGRLGGVGLVH